MRTRFYSFFSKFSRKAPNLLSLVLFANIKTIATIP